MTPGPAVGDRLGRYTLAEDLGQGALGPVFGATDSRDRRVVLRTLGGAFAEDRNLWRALRDAGGRVRRMSHPAPARVLDFLDTPGCKGLVEERVDGHSLGQELDARGGALPPARAYALFVQAADAVAAAHDMELPHLRLNPQAVVLGRDEASGREAVRICGLGVGLALLESGAAPTAVHRDTPVHLAYYFAPEQVHRAMTPSARSDVYALGVMVYEGLTGYVPFGGDDVYAVVRGHLMDPPPPPRTLVPDLPWHVEAVTLLALTKHPEDRLASAADLAAYLRGCAAEAVIPAAPPRETPRVAAPPAPAREKPPAAAPAPPPPAPPPPEDDDQDAVHTALTSLEDVLAAAGVDADEPEDTNPSLRATPDDDAGAVELPEGVPNPSYLVLLRPASRRR